MNFSTKLTFTALIFFLTAGLIYAQEEPDTTYVVEYEETYSDRIPRVNLASISGVVIQPTGAFHRLHPGVMGGLQVDFFRQYRPEKPLFFGLTIGYGVVNVYSDDVVRYFDTIAETWNATTTTSLIDFRFGLRYFFDINLLGIEPYAQFNSGANWLFTNTNFSFPGGDETDNRFEGGDMVFTYGGSLGFIVFLSGDAYLNTAVGIHQGLSASYFVEKEEKAEEYESTIEAFDRRHSATNFIKYSLGLTFAF